MLMAVMAIMSLTAAAQNWYAGGNVGFWRNSTENTTEFSILPELGYNLNSTWAIGASFGYGHTYEEGLSINLGKINPYVRYSFFNNEKDNLFCDGGVDLGFGASKYEGESSDTAVTYGIGFKPGFSYNISSKFSLVAHLGFLGYQGGNDASHAADEGGLTLNLNNVAFGFYYNF